MENLGKKGNTDVQTILNSTAPLFYICRIMGILPFSLIDYRKYKQLKTSIFGNVWCLTAILIHCTQYYIAMNNSLKDNWGGDTNTLTSVIGIFIVAMEPVMMAVSILMILFHQNTFITCVERLAIVDGKLKALTAKIPNERKVKNLTAILITATCVCEFGLVIFNFMQFTISEDILYQSYWWFGSGIPILFDGIARLWYIIMIYLVKRRIETVNEYFCELQHIMKEKKDKYENINAKHQIPKEPIVSIGYLGQEIVDPKKRSDKKVLFVKSNKIKALINEEEPSNTKSRGAWTTLGPRIVVNDKMDRKLIELAHLVDELCEILKVINKIFNFPILLTMAYGFMSVTAQLYFLYCGLVGQVIPVLFRSAESITISMLYIAYTSAKCVSIILVSWKTKLEAQKTGIHMHKLANVIDENHFYYIVNHLSLKLLNNQLSLTACGFFELDMTTIYAVGYIR